MQNYKVGMGTRLKEKRRSHHLTQEQMADRLNISIKHYSEVERGISGLSVENIINVCDILGVSIDYLLQGKETEMEVPVKILELFRGCPEEKQYLLLEIMDAISKLCGDDAADG